MPETQKADLSTQLINAVKRTPGNIVGGGVDLANLVLGLATGKGLGGLVPEPTGGSESINKLFGLGKDKAPTNDLVEGLLGMVNPGMVAKTAAGAGAAALASMFTKGSKAAKPVASNQRGVIGMPGDLGVSFAEQKAALREIGAGNAGEVYRSTGMYVDPATGKLLKVVPDTGTALKYTPDVGVSVNVMDTAKGPTIAGVHPPFSKAGSTLEDIASGPMFKAYPELAGTKVGMLSPYTRDSASYSAKNDLMKFGPSDTISQFLQTILHESQHKIQDISSMSPGGNWEMFLPDREKFRAALKNVRQQDPNGPAATELERVYRQAFRAYENMPGEVQARLVERQFRTNDYSTHPKTMMEDMGIDLKAFTPEGYTVPLTKEVNDLIEFWATPGAAAGKAKP